MNNKKRKNNLPFFVFSGKMVLNRTLIFSFLLLVVSSCKKEKQAPPPAQDVNFVRAESFLSKDRDSAFYYFNKVTTVSRDSLRIALSFSNMAIIQSDAGDYFGAQESLLTSLKFLNEKKDQDFNCLSANYSELGLSSYQLKNYDTALSYYDRALKFTKYKASRLIILNNKAAVYQDIKAYPKAIETYQEIISGTKGNLTDYAMVLTNLSFTKWLQTPSYNAAPELLKALDIRIRENIVWGQNSSYAHLADYYTASRPDSALLFAEKMYAVSRSLKSPYDQREALQKLIRLSPAEKAKSYFDIFQQLDDSLQTARNSAKNQFALIRYETEKNKADNLRLQKENTEKKYQLIKQEIIIGSILIIVFAGAAFGSFWLRKRKQRLEQEANTAIAENLLRTSKKVHDVVANGLYRVMTEIDNLDNIDKDSLLDKIELLYEKSRDISYEDLRPSNQDFSEKISDLLSSFITENTKVVQLGNTEALWEKVNPQAKEEIEHVIQELLVNMRKHSRASSVFIRFERIKKAIHISYTDNGVGIAESTKFNNGLRNTGNRIDSICGKINFDTKAEKGLKVRISFPVS